MRWLSQKTIMAAAKKSDLAALECSKKHWEQLRDASFEEIREAWRTEECYPGTRYCACCNRFDSCGDCLLSVHGCCNGWWNNAACMHDRIIREQVIVSEAEWQKACQNLIDFIDSKIQESSNEN